MAVLPVLLFDLTPVHPYAMSMGCISVYNLIKTNSMKEIVSTSSIVLKWAGAILEQ